MSETSVSNTLEERGSRYGVFRDHASISQEIKYAMRRSSNGTLATGWNGLAPDQQEALDMIAHKIARILNGDPNYADSWHDIAGYASLVDKRLNGETI